jgi:hypothetical protein
MSKIVDTEVGRFRQVTDGTKSWFLWECPKCGQWGNLSEAQWNAEVSVVCSGPIGKTCDYHETHRYGSILVASIQAMKLMGYKPYHDEGEDRWANPIPGGVDGPM